MIPHRPTRSFLPLLCFSMVFHRFACFSSVSPPKKPRSGGLFIAANGRRRRRAKNYGKTPKRGKKKKPIPDGDRVTFEPRPWRGPAAGSSCSQVTAPPDPMGFGVGFVGEGASLNSEGFWGEVIPIWGIFWDGGSQNSSWMCGEKPDPTWRSWEVGKSMRFGGKRAKLGQNGDAGLGVSTRPLRARPGRGS